MIDITHHLAGAADPVGKSIGFLIPVFSAPYTNALLVERVGKNGAVASYTKLAQENANLLRLPEHESKIGDPASWVFHFGGKDAIVGQGSTGRDELSSRLQSDFFITRPMLGLEVAEFLGLPAIRLTQAAAVHKTIASRSSELANQWRDLSILTPDLRAYLTENLSKRSYKKYIKSVGSVVAYVHDNILTVQGPAQLGDVDVAAEIRAGAYEVLRRLAPLYKNYKKLEVRTVAPEQSSALMSSAQRQVAALAYVAENDLAKSYGNFRGVSSDGIRVYTHSSRALFTQQSAEFRGLSLIVSHFDPDSEAQHMMEHLDSRPIGIFVPRKSIQKFSPKIVHSLLTLPQPTIVIASKDYGAWLPRDGLSGETKDAAYLLSKMWNRGSSDIKSHLNNAIFMRTVGRGPSLYNDAWAQLYDRCLKAGLLNPVGLAVGFDSLSADTVFDAQHLLFPKLDQLNINLDHLRGRVHAAAFISVAALQMDTYTETASTQAEVVAALLHAQKWRLFPKTHRKAQFTINSSSERYNIEVRNHTPTQRARETFKADRFEINAIRDLVVVPEAGPIAILAMLRTEERLLVTTRDLIAWPSKEASIWGIIAAQLNRFAGSLPSRGKSMYLAMLVNELVGMDRIEMADATTKQLLAFIHHPRFGETFHLHCSGVRFESNRKLARLRASAHFPARGEGLVFHLDINPNGPMLV